MEAEEEKSKFSIIKLIPVTVLITALAQFSNIFYYGLFNFSAVTYFESYEVIIASSKDFFISFALVFIALQFLHTKGVIKNTTSSLTDSLTSQERRHKRIVTRKYLRSTIIGCYLVSCILLVLIIIQLKFHILGRNGDSFCFVALWIIAVLIVYANSFRYRIIIRLRNYRARHAKKYFPYIDPIMFMSISLLFYFAAVFSVIKHNQIQTKNPYKGSQLITEDGEVIMCTSKVIFIGKSQKYYFVYCTPDSSIRIVARENLKKEVIRVEPYTSFFVRF